MRTQFTATGDFVLKNVGSVVQNIRRAFGNVLGETMPKISVMKMVKWSTYTESPHRQNTNEKTKYPFNQHFQQIPSLNGCWSDDWPKPHISHQSARNGNNKTNKGHTWLHSTTPNPYREIALFNWMTSGQHLCVTSISIHRLQSKRNRVSNNEYSTSMKSSKTTSTGSPHWPSSTRRPITMKSFCWGRNSLICWVQTYMTRDRRPE